MPRTITTQVYQYEELTDKAKERARDWYREASAGDNYFAEATIEDAVRMGGMLGITIDTRPYKTMGGKTMHEPAIYWQLHVQGAGASFDGRYEYRKGSARAIAKEAPPQPSDEPRRGNTELCRIARELAELQRRHAYRLTARVKVGDNSVHQYAANVEVFDGDNEADEPTSNAVRDLLRDFMVWIYHTLDAEYDYHMSDEAVAETIEANEYEFTEDGDRA